MAKGKPVYVLIRTTLKMKPLVEAEAANPKATFKIVYYEKASMWEYLDPKAGEIPFIHYFYVTFRSMYAAKAFMKKYGGKFRNSYWAKKCNDETPYIMYIG